MKTKLFLYILCVVTAFVNAQDLGFKHLQVEDGLSQNSVICMLQDSRGFMWFGTKDGLNRYDGYNFKIFQHIPGDPTSIGSNFIRCLHESGDFLWVGTDTGLFKYDEKLESFSLIEATKSMPILDIECNNKSELWFVAAGSLFKMDLKDKNAKLEKYDQFYANYISSNNQGETFVASASELYKYEPDNNSFLNQPLDFNTLDKTIITTIKATDANHIYIGTKNNGAYEHQLKPQTTRALLSANENPVFVRDFLTKEDDELWIASESGIYIYNTKSHQYQNYKKNYGNPYALSDNAIYTLVKDKEDGIWVGTYFGGVNYYPKPYTPFKRYFPRVGENSISGNAVREVEKDQYGNLWIGTEDAGLNKLNLKTGYITNYGYQGNGGILSHYNIHGLLAKEDELWIGTFEHGLDVMHIPTGKIIKHYGTGTNEGGLQSDFILYIHQTKAKEIYVLTSSGIHKYNKKNDSFTLVEGFPEVYHYTYFLEDHNGVLWAGTYWDGLYYFNPKTKEKGFFKYENNNQNSISSNVINGIFEDSSNRLWITTENGLNLYNPKTNNFKRYTKTTGLSSNVTYSILEDKAHQLWISSSNGLMKFNPEDETINVFTKSNGLLSDQFNYCSAYKDDNGEMYFGSVKGLISFNPSHFTQNIFNPPVYVTDIYINNEEVPVGKQNSPLENSILFSNHITLANNQSTFALEFASLSFTSPEMTTYWYKLEGLNNAWVSLGKNHEVNFTELPAGTYTFKVKALNNYEVWSKENAVLTITILPPFYFSKLAIVCYAIVFALLVYLGLRYYHSYNKAKNNRKIQQLENEKEKEIYQAKIEFFTNIAHEIRTPLTLIKSPLEKLLKQQYKSPEVPKNLGIMEKNTARLLNLINELLDFRKAEMKNVKLSFIEVNISDVVRDTTLRFSQLIQERNINFQFITQKEDVFAFVDEEAFKKILSNLIGNAVKYSKEHVEVYLSTNDNTFQLVIKNDGQRIPISLKAKIFEPFFRIPADQQHTGTGIGLSLAHSLAELHQGTLTLDEQDESMNTFVLQMPLHQHKEFKGMKVIQGGAHTAHDKQQVKQHKQAPTILVAEDNKELADFMFTELSEHYNVIQASNGEEAWQYIQQQQVQLVISDVMMPLKSGIALCKDIKNKDEISHIPVILLTAKSALNAKIEGLESGADAYITKPFSMDYLLVQIANLITNRKHIVGHLASSPLAHLQSVTMSNEDKTFLKQLDKVIEDEMKDQTLNVDKLAAHMNMSRSTLYRSIKEITDVSPNELINSSRLKKAAELIKSTNMKIYEIAEMVGYKSQTSFGRNFQKHYGMTPSEFLKITFKEED